MIKLVAFLGNYGREYEKTRHNVAWQFAQSLPFYSRLSWQEKFKGEFCAVDMKNLASYFFETNLLSTKDGNPPRVLDDFPEKIFFLKPLTFMNLSGEAIVELAHFYKIEPNEILVVHDELELPLGTVSLKWSGGLGGHNGLRSTKSTLGTADFWRLRFGLSKPANRNIADYVLSAFEDDEQEILKTVFEKTAPFFAQLLFTKDASRLITAWGKKKIAEKKNVGL